MSLADKHQSTMLQSPELSYQKEGVFKKVGLIRMDSGPSERVKKRQTDKRMEIMSQIDKLNESN